MSSSVRNTALCLHLVSVTTSALIAVLLSPPVSAQPAPGSAEFEKLVEYSQCIRDNGYPDFPDPTQGGNVRIQLKPGTMEKFQAAQKSCVDKMPAGLAAGMQPPTPERMDSLLKFAVCMRESGLQEFPDPGPDGTFELTGNLDLMSPQAETARNACMQSNPVQGLSIRSVRRVPQ